MNFTRASLPVKDIVLRIAVRLAPKSVFVKPGSNEEPYACGTAIARENFAAFDVNCRSN
jgi:hypothetical protein